MLDPREALSDDELDDLAEFINQEDESTQTQTTGMRFLAPEAPSLEELARRTQPSEANRPEQGVAPQQQQPGAQQSPTL